MSRNLPDPKSEYTPPAVREKDAFKRSLLSARNDGVRVPESMTNVSGSLRPTVVEDEEDIGRQTIMDLNAPPKDPYTVKESVKKKPAVPKYESHVEAITDFLNHMNEEEQVSIKGDFGKISFKAIHVSVNGNGVAIIVKKDSMQFEPKINADLEVIYKDRHIPVVYAGGFFTFSQIPFTFISFVRITTGEEPEQEFNYD